MSINLNGKIFKSLSNTANGEVSDATTFQYYQEGEIIWATYEGGAVLKGFLVGKIVGQSLQFTYQHLNQQMDIMTGQCESFPEKLENGKIILKEYWQWTSGDFSKGESGGGGNIRAVSGFYGIVVSWSSGLRNNISCQRSVLKIPTIEHFRSSL